MIRKITLLTLCCCLLLFNGGLVAALSDAQKSLFKRGVNWYDIATCATAGDDTATTVTLTGSDNTQRAFNFLVGKGLTQMQAAAIVGNLQQESSVSPKAVNKSSGAYGIAQWLGGRFNNLKSHAGAAYDTLGGQLDFLWYEVTEGTEKSDGALTAIKAASNIKEATEQWELKFERAGTNEAALANRVAFARAILQKYGDGTEVTSNDDESATDLGGCPTGGGLNIMTYNILGDAQGRGANGHPNNGGLDWKTRAKSVVKTVNERKPAVISFQEFNNNQYAYLKDALSTYDVAPPKDIGKSGYQRPIFWDKSVFSLAKRGVYHFNKNGIEAYFTWVKLKYINTGATVYFFDHHNTAEPGTTQAKNRASQARSLIKAIKDNDTDSSPVIALGDFNSTLKIRASGKDGGISVSELPVNIMKSAGYTDSYGIAATKVNAEYNTSHVTAGVKRTKGESKIDHIFVSDGITVNSWETIITEDTRIGSDHTPVIDNLSIPGIVADDDDKAASAGSSTDTMTGSWGWPVKKTDYKPINVCFQKPGHTGIDIPVPSGTPVYAARAGTVTAAHKTSSGDGGKYIIIKHGDNLYSNYQHNSEVLVKVGQTVKAGDLIAKSGQTGYATGPHVHFSIATRNYLDSRGTVAFSKDPIDYLPHDRNLGGCK